MSIYKNENGKLVRFDSGGGGNSIAISATQPTDQKAGDLWFVISKQLPNIPNTNYLVNGDFKKNSNGLTTYTSTTSDVEIVDGWTMYGKEGCLKLDVLENGVRLYAPVSDPNNNTGMDIEQTVKLQIPNIDYISGENQWNLVLSGKITNVTQTGIKNNDDQIVSVSFSVSQTTTFQSGMNIWYGNFNADGSFSMSYSDVNIYKKYPNAKELYIRVMIDLYDRNGIEGATTECTIQDMALKFVLAD